MSKDKIINFKIEEEVKTEFEATCKGNFTSPSHELRLFTHQYIKRHKGSKIPLSDLHNKS